jgi:hypothetical protein
MTTIAFAYLGVAMKDVHTSFKAVKRSCSKKEFVEGIFERGRLGGRRSSLAPSKLNVSSPNHNQKTTNNFGNIKKLINDQNGTRTHALSNQETVETDVEAV